MVHGLPNMVQVLLFSYGSIRNEKSLGSLTLHLQEYSRYMDSNLLDRDLSVRRFCPPHGNEER